MDELYANLFIYALCCILIGGGLTALIGVFAIIIFRNKKPRTSGMKDSFPSKQQTTRKKPAQEVTSTKQSRPKMTSMTSSYPSSVSHGSFIMNDH